MPVACGLGGSQDSCDAKYLSDECVVCHGAFHEVANATTRNAVRRSVCPGTVDSVDAGSVCGCWRMHAVVARTRDDLSMKVFGDVHADLAAHCAADELTPAVVGAEHAPVVCGEGEAVGRVTRHA